MTDRKLIIFLHILASELARYRALSHDLFGAPQALLNNAEYVSVILSNNDLPAEEKLKEIEAVWPACGANIAKLNALFTELAPLFKSIEISDPDGRKETLQ